MDLDEVRQKIDSIRLDVLEAALDEPKSAPDLSPPILEDLQQEVGMGDFVTRTELKEFFNLPQNDTGFYLVWEKRNLLTPFCHPAFDEEKAAKLGYLAQPKVYARSQVDALFEYYTLLERMKEHYLTKAQILEYTGLTSSGLKYLIQQGFPSIKIPYKKHDQYFFDKKAVDDWMIGWEGNPENVEGFVNAIQAQTITGYSLPTIRTYVQKGELRCIIKRRGKSPFVKKGFRQGFWFLAEDLGKWKKMMDEKVDGRHRWIGKERPLHLDPEAEAIEAAKKPELISTRKEADLVMTIDVDPKAAKKAKKLSGEDLTEESIKNLANSLIKSVDERETCTPLELKDYIESYKILKQQFARLRRKKKKNLGTQITRDVILALQRKAHVMLNSGVQLKPYDMKILLQAIKAMTAEEDAIDQGEVEDTGLQVDEVFAKIVL